MRNLAIVLILLNCATVWAQPNGPKPPSVSENKLHKSITSESDLVVLVGKFENQYKTCQLFSPNYVKNSTFAGSNEKLPNNGGLLLEYYDDLKHMQLEDDFRQLERDKISDNSSPKPCEKCDKYKNDMKCLFSNADFNESLSLAIHAENLNKILTPYGYDEKKSKELEDFFHQLMKQFKP